MYSETGEDANSSGITISNTTHKYILFSDDSEALYNLSTDPLEAKNLLNSRNLPLSEENLEIKTALIKNLGDLKN